MGRNSKSNGKKKQNSAEAPNLSELCKNYGDMITIEAVASWTVVASIAIFLSVYFLAIYSKAGLPQYIDDLSPPATMLEAARYSPIVGIIILFSLMFSPVLCILINFAKDEKNIYRKNALYALYLLIIGLPLICAVYSNYNAIFPLILLYMVIACCVLSKKFTFGSMSVIYFSCILLSWTFINIPDHDKKYLKGYPVVMQTTIEKYPSVTVCKITRIGEILHLVTTQDKLTIGASTFLSFSDVPDSEIQEATALCNNRNKK